MRWLKLKQLRLPMTGCCWCWWPPLKTVSTCWFGCRFCKSLIRDHLKDLVGGQRGWLILGRQQHKSGVQRGVKLKVDVGVGLGDGKPHSPRGERRKALRHWRLLLLVMMVRVIAAAAAAWFRGWQSDFLKVRRITGEGKWTVVWRQLIGRWGGGGGTMRGITRKVVTGAAIKWIRKRGSRGKVGWARVEVLHDDAGHFGI